MVATNNSCQEYCKVGQKYHGGCVNYTWSTGSENGWVEARMDSHWVECANSLQ